MIQKELRVLSHFSAKNTPSTCMTVKPKLCDQRHHKLSLQFCALISLLVKKEYTLACNFDWEKKLILRRLILII